MGYDTHGDFASVNQNPLGGFIADLIIRAHFGVGEKGLERMGADMGQKIWITNDI